MKFYRYDLTYNATTVGGYKTPDVTLKLRVYDMIRETPKGYWISPIRGFEKKWISKTSYKRFAYPTKKEALNNFIGRKGKRERILSFQAKICNEAIKKADIEMKTLDNI